MLWLIDERSYDNSRAGAITGAHRAHRSGKGLRAEFLCFTSLVAVLDRAQMYTSTQSPTSLLRHRVCLVDLLNGPTSLLRVRLDFRMTSSRSGSVQGKSELNMLRTKNV